MLIMNSNYVCHGLISPHVNFHNTRLVVTVILIVKICRWGEKEKSKMIRHGIHLM